MDTKTKEIISHILSNAMIYAHSGSGTEAKISAQAYMNRFCDELEAKFNSLESRLKEAEKALEKYANEPNWKTVISMYSDIRQVFGPNRDAPWTDAQFYFDKWGKR